MKNQKNRNYYQNLHYEQEQAKKDRLAKKEKKENHEATEIRRFRFLRIALLPNLTNLLLNNLCFLLLCIPAFVFAELALQTGAIIFLAGFWISMGLLFPGFNALYHRSYEYARRIAPSVRASFFSFMARNFRPAAAAGLILGFFWSLCIAYLVISQMWMENVPPTFYGFILFLLFLINYYTVMVIVQLSQFDLPLKAILKNAFLLIPSCGWRGLISALLQLAFLLLLFENLYTGLFFFFLGVPCIISTLTAWLLWPRLSKILLHTLPADD